MMVRFGATSNFSYEVRNFLVEEAPPKRPMNALREAEQEVAVGDLDGELDAEIDERFEAFEVGDHLGQLGGFIWPDITAIAALTERIAQLPIRAVFLAWALELLAEGTGPHGAELVDGGLGLIELFLPGFEFFVLHTDGYRGPYRHQVKLFPMKCGFFWWRRHRPSGR